LKGADIQNERSAVQLRVVAGSCSSSIPYELVHEWLVFSNGSMVFEIRPRFLPNFSPRIDFDKTMGEWEPSGALLDLVIRKNIL